MSDHNSATVVAEQLQTHVPEDHRVLGEAQAAQIYKQITELWQGRGNLIVELSAWWRGEIRWARNRVTLASDRRDIRVLLTLQDDHAGDTRILTNQVNEQGLKTALDSLKKGVTIRVGGKIDERGGLTYERPYLPYPETTIWSDSTFGVTPAKRAEIAQTLTEKSAAQGLQASGFVSMRVGEQYRWAEWLAYVAGRNERMATGDGRVQGSGAGRTAQDNGYVRYTEAQCSTTVRHPKGTGSGWAGLSGFDWAMFQPGELAARALDKCVRSLNPVAIEPGRYTVILEPQALFEMISPQSRDERNQGMIGQLNKRQEHETRNSGSDWTLEFDQVLGLQKTKIGLKVFDERVTISHDPMHPSLGTIPELGLTPITWIENGILRDLGNMNSAGVGASADGSAMDYALQTHGTDEAGKISRYAFAMAGGGTSMEEMIATSKRALLVTRFGSVANQGNGALQTGFTRDGLWLIENGKISKAVKNMRYRDSAYFVLNQLEQIGVPQFVFRPGDDDLQPALVPAVKAKDFAFTTTSDAV